MLQNKINFIKRGNYDELYTPPEAVEIIIPYIPNYIKNVWECTAIPNGNISTILSQNGFNVINSHIADNKDFFSFEPDNYDIIITNPPLFS